MTNLKGNLKNVQGIDCFLTVGKVSALQLFYSDSFESFFSLGGLTPFINNLHIIHISLDMGIEHVSF